MSFQWELIFRLGLALVFGSIIGVEREYRSKAAGFRTITIITMGATLFTICSFKLGAPGNSDRIASNIITGIGFIGAGVIFKDGFSVSGLTTAATIWISAAIGMSLGIGEYILASFTLVGAIVVLALFELIQDVIDSLHQVRSYKICMHLDFEKAKEEIEMQMEKCKISHKITHRMRSQDEEVVITYSLAGTQKQLDLFSAYLMGERNIKSFDE
jgi:putative Mg2+ transporter-C (MgtC) family protein